MGDLQRSVKDGGFYPGWADTVGLLAVAVHATTVGMDDHEKFELPLEKPEYPALPSGIARATMKPYGSSNIAGCPIILLVTVGILGIIIGSQWRRWWQGKRRY